MGMAARQKTKFAILGLLSLKPMSGYDIKKLVDVGLSHFWNENYGQIYPTLDALVKEQLVTKKGDQSRGKRRRNVYAITRKGRLAVQNWQLEPTEPPIVRNELQLKLFLGGNLTKRQRIQLIEAYQVQQQAALDDYRQSEQVLRNAVEKGEYIEELDEILDLTSSNPKDRAKQCNIFYLTLRHGIRTTEARLAWCREVLENLANGP